MGRKSASAEREVKKCFIKIRRQTLSAGTSAGYFAASARASMAVQSQVPRERVAHDPRVEARWSLTRLATAGHGL